MKVYPERTTGYVRVRFLDKDNALQPPTLVQYRIDCATSGDVVRDWTTLVPGADVEITLTASDNAMRNATNRSERRVLSVFGQYGVDDEVRSTCEFYVQNLDHVG